MDKLIEGVLMIIVFVIVAGIISLIIWGLGALVAWIIGVSVDTTLLVPVIVSFILAAGFAGLAQASLS